MQSQQKQQLKAKNIAIEDVKNKIYVFELEEKLLLDNSNLNKNGAGSSVAEIKEAAIYYRARLNEIKANSLQLKSSLEKMVDDKQDIYQKLNELRGRKINTYSEILISIECKTIFNGKGYTRGKFKCKKRRFVQFTKTKKQKTRKNI